ncbi:MAG TPA: OadG family protein [Clostridia bacterium]|mgnify:CR=1 FL=1|jgi:predicted membrane protein|nr:OadG family protein [Clostridia bacterium]
MLLALTPLQKLSTGSVTFLIGMIITFVVLAVLIGIIYLVNYLINRVDFKKIFSKKNSAKKIDDVTEPSSDSVAENIVVEEKINSAKEEAINAAVKEYLAKADDVPHTRYKVISVKKVAKEDA